MVSLQIPVDAWNPRYLFPIRQSIGGKVFPVKFTHSYNFEVIFYRGWYSFQVIRYIDQTICKPNIDKALIP